MHLGGKKRKLDPAASSCMQGGLREGKERREEKAPSPKGE
jgi:hypothetical protein